MAMVSELSMNQASAMKLQTEVKEQEAYLEQVTASRPTNTVIYVKVEM